MDVFLRAVVAWPLRLRKADATLQQTKERKHMRGRKIFLPAVMIAGSLGLSALPSWAQGTPGGARPSNPEQPRSGAAESVPGSRAGTQELSQNDMKLIQQRLEEKGYKPGNVDGRADDTTRAAIKKFQQDEGIPTTGTIDEVTANRLGFRYAKGPTDRGGTGERSAPAEQPSPR
jgi:peptidoglycan hydrolase-like protein with peptidoglycan-binding domain